MTNSSDRPNQSAPNVPNAATPASHQTPVSDHAYQTNSSPPSIAPASSPAQPSHVTKPAVFYVPRNSRQVLDFSPNSRTPENTAKKALLSIDRDQNAIALVGMGGAGKTTILRALGRNPDVWTKFPDGVWFIQLGHDATVQKLLDHLKAVVTEAFPTFIPRFTELAASENTHVLMMEKLVDLLAQKQFLLMFDDVWDADPNVYTLVDSACQAVQGIERASCKVLTSTRNEKVGRVPTHDVSISVRPELSRKETCVEILCCYAGIRPHTLPSFSSPNRDALDKIIDFCAGLPLALSVAGSALQDVLGTRTDVCGPDGIVQYWESLQKSRTQVSDAEGGNRHVGLNAAVQLSLESLEKEWKGKSMTVREMFRSFCVMEKQMSLPLCAIEKLWGVNDALVGVRMFSRHSVVSLDVDKKGLIVGVRLHDLVHDLCVEMAKGSEGVGTWHARFVKAYQESIRTCEGANDEQVDEESNSTAGEEWWKLGSKDQYMIDNVVRHLVGAGKATDALQLLTEYRWIQEMNDNKEQLPFQKIISELQLLRMHLEKSEETGMCRRVVSDIGIVERAMVLCMVPYCVKNRKECTFQLYGRLRDVSSESGIVERIICSIERYGRRPWARAGPGVLRSGRSSLKRVLEVESEGRCICTGAGEEVVVGGCEGMVLVLNSRDGKVKKSLIGYEEDDEVRNVFFDRSSALIYSCSEKGQVIIWKEYENWRSMEAELEHEEKSTSMQVLPTVGKVVLGTSRGRLVVMDIDSGTTIQTVNAHENEVSSLAVSGSEDIMVSGSWDGNIHVWDTESFDSARVIKGHADRVHCVALTRDGNLLASGSLDETTRIWDVRSGENLWTSPEQSIERVQSVLFSSDGRFLYSANLNFLWMWRVRNDGRDASLVQTLPNAHIFFDCAFCIRDDSELFGLIGTKVQVWDAQPVSSSNEQDDVFLPSVYSFAVSEDAATMLTWNIRSRCLEIRSMEDVSQQTDRVISSCKIPNNFGWPHQLAVSNNRRFVAFQAGLRNCDVYVVEVQNGNVLHFFSDLDDWALSLTPDGEEVSSHCSGSDDSSSTAQEGPERGIESMWFSPDCSLISATAGAQKDGEVGAVESKSMSWNVSSGELFDEVQPDGDSTASNIAANPRLVCNPEFDGDISSVLFPSNVTYKEGDSSFTIATVEGVVDGAHYFPDTSRLFFSSSYRMYHIDLVIDSTQLPRPDEPPLPPLPQPHPHPPPSDEVYDVFISHAGTDKLTIAEPLYDLLVALGFKVFLDKEELRPGQKASENMINAMRTAKIAVVILSPEFAARKWTLKELMCFLERFEKGGEREVIIIPVFYRLTLNDCRDDSLFNMADENGQSVFMKEEFLQRMAKEREYGVGDVLKALQSLRNITGIENKNRVTNGDSAAEKAAQRIFVEEIRDAIVEAMGRRKSGTAVGLNLAQWFSCTVA